MAAVAKSEAVAKGTGANNYSSNQGNNHNNAIGEIKIKRDTPAIPK